MKGRDKSTIGYQEFACIYGHGAWKEDASNIIVTITTPPIIQGTKEEIQFTLDEILPSDISIVVPKKLEPFVDVIEFYSAKDGIMYEQYVYQFIFKNLKLYL